MRKFSTALNITVGNHELVNAGYIQLPVAIKVTEKWLDTPSILYKQTTNRTRLLSELAKYEITDENLKALIGKTVKMVPDETLYSAYLETSSTDKIMNQKDLSYEAVQRNMTENDAYIEKMSAVYSEISEQLIARVWNYHAFKNQVNEEYLMHAHKEMCTETMIQALLFLIAKAPEFSLENCFKE